MSGQRGQLPPPFFEGSKQSPDFFEILKARTADITLQAAIGAGVDRQYRLAFGHCCQRNFCRGKRDHGATGDTLD